MQSLWSATCLLLAILPIVVLGTGCSDEIVKPPIEQNVASPIDIATSPSGNYFFVLNADYSFRYAQGSILVVDSEGQKIAAYATPRLGRSMTVAGNDLLVTYDQQDDAEDIYGLVDLFSISEESGSPPVITHQKRFVTNNCAPINAVARSGFSYFAVSCLGGRVFVGELTADRAQSTLSLVREYGGKTSRRAMYIDDKRGLLFGFVTDTGKPNLSDWKTADLHTWDIQTGDYTPNTPDGAPDKLMQTDRSRRLVRDEGSPYQYFVYDFVAEATERAAGSSFPHKTWQSHPDQMKKELRWMYFNLTNFDGTPDDPVGYTQVDGSRYYRTNFWQASPDPKDPDAFYLSQRGLGLKARSEHANSIIRVSLVGDPRPSADGTVPSTESIFRFKRVFGFKGSAQLPEFTYLASFAIGEMNGQQIVLANSFHDLVNFEHQRYMVMAASIDDPQAWSVRQASESLTDSYFQLAVGNGGRVLVSSFYDNSVILLKLTFGERLELSKRIR